MSIVKNKEADCSALSMNVQRQFMWLQACWPPAKPVCAYGIVEMHNLTAVEELTCNAMLTWMEGSCL